MGYNLIADLAERHTRVGRCILCGHGPGAATTPWGACKHCAPTPDGDRLLAAVRATDPRDAEIARLKAEVERLRECNEVMRAPMTALRDAAGMPAEGEGAVVARVLHDLAAHKRALAAGPVALRGSIYDGVAEMVLAAQEAALKDDDKKGGG